MIDLSRYRIIDLSYELVPSERKIDGTYLHGEPITPDDLAGAGVRTGDIVLAWGSDRHADNPPHLTVEAVDWLIDRRIKAMASTTCDTRRPARPSDWRTPTHNSSLPASAT